jgi:hypothetical protein
MYEQLLERELRFCNVLLFIFVFFAGLFAGILWDTL